MRAKHFCNKFKGTLGYSGHVLATSNIELKYDIGHMTYIFTHLCMSRDIYTCIYVTWLKYLHLIYTIVTWLVYKYTWFLKKKFKSRDLCIYTSFGFEIMSRDI